MSAELVSDEVAAAPEAGRRPAQHARPARAARLIRPVVDVLADGTVCYAPVGEVVMDGPLVVCHLCGRSFRSVAAHLASHGWTKQRYCTAFGLELGQPLEGQETLKLRAAALTARLLFEPAMREGSAAGRARAKSGELAKDAAAAARGRSFPEQRRRKASRVRTPSAAVVQANRDRADRRLADVAAGVARQHGYADIGAYVAARRRVGLSLAAISREAGLHKDWLSRHLRRVDPAGQAGAARVGGLAGAAGGGLVAAVARLGFQDPAAYLRERHLRQHYTVNAMAAELGVSRRPVESALRTYGFVRVAHAAKRHAAEQRAAEVASELGFPSVADYVAQRRAVGLTWSAIAAESGQPQTWLRRHAATPPGS